MTKRSMNIVKILAIVAILVLAMSMVFVGCNKLKDAGKPEAEVGTKTVTILLQNGDKYDKYVATTEKEYVQDVLVELKNAEKFVYDFHNTEYGAFIDKLGTMSPDSSKGEYIFVFHDINDASLVGFWTEPVIYDGRYYVNASLGVSSLPVRDGASYLFNVGSYA